MPLREIDCTRCCALRPAPENPPKLDDRDLPVGLRWLDASEIRYPPQAELLREAARRFRVSQAAVRRALHNQASVRRLLEMLELYDLAEGCLADPATWFQLPNPSLEGRTPFELVGNTASRQRVSNLLTNIEFGTAP